MMRNGFDIFNKGGCMYNCAMCKKQMDGDAALINAAGMFCQSCKEIMHERGVESRLTNNQTTAGYCVWCRHKITPANAQANKDVNVCTPCAGKRDWLLGSIRLSEHAARYVSRIEKRERPMREKRNKASAIANPQPPVAAEKTTPPADDQMRRMELLLTKLAQALGI